MGRTLHKLTATGAASFKEPGRYSDGGGLYLHISKNGGRRWVFRFSRNGRVREMGLGSAREVTLKRAREKAAQVRDQLAEGTDPFAARAAEANETSRASGVLTFAAFVEEFLSTIEAGFRNEKHKAQWRMTLGEAYCKPLLDKPLHEIQKTDIVRVLQPIWLAKSETASRLRGRLERVFDAARYKELYPHENPARFKGHLEFVLPRQRKLQRGHHAAAPYDRVPEIYAKLSSAGGIAARALQFVILTAARTGEALNARWGEVDLQGRVWTVPAERMKAGKEHKVPLSDAAVLILREMIDFSPESSREEHHIFPGARANRPLSSMAMTMALRRACDQHCTVHGMRSAFRDFAGNETDFPREVAEECLAHTIGNKTERAYRRQTALDKQRALLEAWAAHATSKVPL
ncbi:tyrosine-type recombinase/integrase [Nitratireductor sp. CH_MIT9313-5]|uniref:tyrosine-type recombinase/integrase n=1 Tax=Nitratireductor sp. CH_MIT9313-5 TaxID=3107764 RepID=UPI00300A212C